MTNYLALSEGAANHFQAYGPPPAEWFTGFEQKLTLLPQVELGDFIFILTHAEIEQAVDGSYYLLRTEQSELFKDVRAPRKVEAFRRAIRVLQSGDDKSIAIPMLWKSFTNDSWISFQSNARGTGERSRLLVDRERVGIIAGYCHGVISEDVDLVTRMPDVPRLAELDVQIRVHVPQVGRAVAAGGSCEYEKEFELEPNMAGFVIGESLDTWYESKLTVRQRAFVDFPISKSVRVRGPAGSGKTVSLVIKLLRHLAADRDAGVRRRYALLTHSEATVQQIESMLRAMVDESELQRLTLSGMLLYSGTIYDLAHRAVGGADKGILPISLDGREGATLQRELLLSVIREYREGDWVARKGGCSKDFINGLEAVGGEDPSGEAFIQSVTQEFACVIEPDGVSRNAKRKSDYLQRKRDGWMVRLDTRDERHVMLDLHKGFREQLRGMDAISLDQLVADYELYLDSNTWEAVQSAEGFDAIFVDELHSLNRFERSVLPMLVKSPDAIPLLVMAQDEKQDTKRVHVGLERWQAGLGDTGVESFDLKDVFRYTPQINRFLRALDDFSPTLNLEEDWPDYGPVAQTESGPVPTAKECASVRAIYEYVFPMASLAAKHAKRGRRIAVLSCDPTAFADYLNAGQYRDRFFPIESRDDVSMIPSTGTRFVLSMPDYVAGLQFEEVFLIDVNQEAPPSDADRNNRDKRRALSQTYLGASRAERRLHIISNRTSGGFPAYVRHAISVGALESMD